MELLRTAAIPVAIGGLFLGLSALLGLLEDPVRHRAFFAQGELISLSHELVLTLPTLAK